MSKCLSQTYIQLDTKEQPASYLPVYFKAKVSMLSSFHTFQDLFKFHTYR